MTRPQAAAAETAATTTTPAKPPTPRAAVRVRPFDAARADAQAVAHMCRDVYGGTDYMPRVIGHLGELALRQEEEEEEEEEHRTIVLVAEEEEEDGAISATTANHRQVGVVVAQLRGEGHAFLFGLRVDPHARGRGVGRVLMRAACDAALASGAQHLVGATIPSNSASIALFLGTGHEERARVGVWPPFPLLAEYERHVGFEPPAGRRPSEQGARYGGASATPTPSVRLLDHLPPGVRGVLLEAAAAGNEQQQPRRCACVDELARALEEVRRAAAAGEEEDSRSSPPSPQWVPAMYEVMPARGPWARERAREGGAWLLPSGGGEAATVEAVVVGGHSLEARRFVVGVVAVDGDAAARALLFAEQRLAPGGHFLAFVDAPTTGRRRGGGGGEEGGGGGDGDNGGCALSRLYALTRLPETHPEGRGCMIVYHRSA